MDPVAFFCLQHGRVHSSRVSDVPSLADRVFGGLTDAQMRARAGPGLNTLVWLLWHMARVEDVGVNVVVAGREPVLDARWAARLGVARADGGTGMTADEVAALSGAVDVGALRAYRDAVGRRTREVVAALGPARWTELFTEADAARAPTWFGVFVGQPRAIELGTCAITHNAMHLGEAVTVRSVSGLPLG